MRAVAGLTWSCAKGCTKWALRFWCWALLCPFRLVRRRLGVPRPQVLSWLLVAVQLGVGVATIQPALVSMWVSVPASDSTELQASRAAPACCCVLACASMM